MRIELSNWERFAIVDTLSTLKGDVESEELQTAYSLFKKLNFNEKQRKEILKPRGDGSVLIADGQAAFDISGKEITEALSHIGKQKPEIQSWDLHKALIGKLRKALSATE